MIPYFIFFLKATKNFEILIFCFSVKQTGDVSFVAFTVCPSYEDAYNLKKLSFYGTSRKQYRDGNFTTENPFNQSAFQIFENVTYSLKEILNEVTISTADSNDSKVLHNSHYYSFYL